jgi:predicted GIY-YIG superfamily endonuclease
MPRQRRLQLLLISHRQQRYLRPQQQLVILSERSESKDLQFAQCRAEGASLLHSSMDRTFYVYIVASRSKTLYIGVTSNIEQRIYEHREEKYPGFSSTYNCNRLVWLEKFTNPATAIAREKQLKG